MRRRVACIRCRLVLGGLALLLLLAGCGREEEPPLRVFPAFRTVDLAGAEATEAIFRRRSFTAVVLWVPGTEPSDSLLPRLEEIAGGLPENAGILTLVAGRHGLADETELAAARRLAESTPHLRHLVANDDFAPLLSHAKSVPMTYFVATGGQMAGLPVPGRNAALVRRELLRLLQTNPARDQAGERLQQNLLR